MTAPARVDSRVDSRRWSEKNETSEPVARARLAGRRTLNAGSPSSSAPMSAASSARGSDFSCSVTGWPFACVERSVAELFQHLLGQIDAAARVDRLLDDEVVPLALGDLDDRLGDYLLKPRQFLVAPEVVVVLELLLQALDPSAQRGDFQLRLVDIGLLHHRRVLVELGLGVAKLRPQLPDLTVARAEFLLQLLQRLFALGRGLDKLYRIHEADFRALGQRWSGRQRTDQHEHPTNLHLQHRHPVYLNKAPSDSWKFSTSSPSSSFRGTP